MKCKINMSSYDSTRDAEVTTGTWNCTAQRDEKG